VKKIYWKYLVSSLIIFSFTGKQGNAQNDTLRIMVQNTLHFGDGCQGTQDFLNAQLKTEVHYLNPDLIGLDKVQAIKLSNSDPYGISPTWFTDSIIYGALNAAFPARYAYCPLTDYSEATDQDMSLLFYNQNKLGFVSIWTLYIGEEDIDLYKLFYKDPNLGSTHDSTFLYVVLCHTISGTSSSGRDGQATTVIDSLQNIFTHLPNLIYMGDFNTHNTSEPGYELITQTTDTSFLFYDPPFHPDNLLVYPIDWTTNPSQAASELTTTTRQSSSIPNSCGNSGGAYDWFDHIFLSRPIINNYDYIRYLPNSWRALGNDGNRVGISVNDSITNGPNTSAPSSVLNSEFQFSDKYPVTVDLGITYNTSTGVSTTKPLNEGNIKVNNPVKNTLTIYFPLYMLGEKVTIGLYDVCGRMLYSSTIIINTSEISENINLTPGVYLLHLQADRCYFTEKIVKE
jgi:hypothetical protein